MMHGQKNIKR